MFVSVVIATRNRSRLLGETLSALAAQQWPTDRFEIIVADNGSSDDTRAVVAAAAARERPTIRYLLVPQPGKSHAVNSALDIAHGDLIALTDDDVRPDPSWIASLVGAVEHRGAHFVAGRILPIWEVPPPAWMSPSLYGVLAIPDNGLVPLPIATASSNPVMPIGANMAVRADVVARVGGLRTDLGKLEGTLRTGEDHEFFLRLLHSGCVGTYEPSALVWHHVPASRLRRSYFRKWLFQNGRDVAVVERAYPQARVLLFGVPRYLWRQAAVDAKQTVTAALRADVARRFASTLRVLWFAGYLAGVWFGAAASRPSRLAIAETQ